MILRLHRGKREWTTGMFAVAFALILFGVILEDTHAAKMNQKTFHSPEDAFADMVAALRDNNEKELVSIFGPYDRDFFMSGKGMEEETCMRFLRAYEEKKRVEMVNDKKAMLHVGKNDWSWPIPVVMVGDRWRFDTQMGKSEILARRIGRNEVAAVQVCLAYIDAQREYALDHRTAKGVGEYAQKFASDEGKKNGLCWDTREEGKVSPLGPEIARACIVSYPGMRPGDKSPEPYHGYFYKILTRQGPNAPGGAFNYVVNGMMVGGFAAVAYPAAYGLTGIMTFIVSQDGVVYQKNLGKGTARIAEAMISFDPDKTWTKVY